MQNTGDTIFFCDKFMQQALDLNKRIKSPIFPPTKLRKLVSRIPIV